MDRAALFGLVIGAVVGGAYAWLHLRSLRRAEAAQKAGQPVGVGRQLPGSLARVAMLMLVLVLLATVPDAKVSKWWLTGSLMVCYSVPFFWRMRLMISKKQ
jgi:hypothetical protein